MASGTARIGRLGDFPRTSNTVEGEDQRPPPGTSIGQTYGSGTSSGWTGGIWGTSALGGGFAKSSNETPRSTDEMPFASNTTTTIDEKSIAGSLVSGSESDTWAHRQTTPWNTGDTITPAISKTGPHETSSMSHRSQQMPSTSHKPRKDSLDPSSYISKLQAPIGQGGPSTAQLPHKHFLDPTSTTFNASGMVPNRTGNYAPTTLNNVFSGLSVGESNQRTAQAVPIHYSDKSGSLVLDRVATQASNFGVGGLSTHGMDSAFSLVGYPLPRHESPGAIAQVPPTPATAHSHHPSHSSHASSLSSQSNARRQEELARDSKRAEMIAALQRMGVQEAAGHYQYGTNSEVGLNSVPAAFANQAGPNSRPPPSTLPLKGWTLDEGAFTGHPGISVPESLSKGAFADQLNPFHSSRLNEQRSISPALDDPRRQRFPDPHYATGRTLPAPPESYHGSPRDDAYGRSLHNGHSTVLDRRLRGLQYEQQEYGPSQINPAWMQGNAMSGPFHANSYELGAQQAFGMNPMMPYMPLQGIPSTVYPPRGPARDSEVGNNLRSPLLEEFRASTKTSRRFELKEIYNHVVEFSGDQHGSRFIQQKLETANSDEKEQIFRELRPNALPLMADVFGNYVIQKFFEHGTQQQKTVLAELMKGHILNLSLQMYGCRVVQKALEHILVEQQAALIKELDVHVLKCVKDANGNHVIQKAIERVPPEHIRSIMDAFTGQVHTLATHPYGCRVIQRMLEHCEGNTQASILRELHACGHALISDTYGNYVTQHIIEHGKDEDRAKVIKLITNQLVHFSKHKFASNVVERSIQFGTDDQRREMMTIVTELSPNGISPLQSLIRDQYGNYVIQKLLGQMKGADRQKLVECIRPQLLALKKYAYGKQISAIEKIVFSASVSTATAPTNSSAAPTPPLSTTGAQSPQSSSFPSTNNSTVDGPVKDDVPQKDSPDEEQ